MKVVFKSVIFVYSGKRETLIKKTEYERDPATVESQHGYKAAVEDNESFCRAVRILYQAWFSLRDR